MAEERRALTYDDFWAYRIVSDVQLAPDGRRAAYVVSTLDRQTDEERSSIWMVDTATGATQKFTRGKGRDVRPRWSRDGLWLAFLSTREREKPQLYVMSTQGGEAQRLTDLEEGVDVPTWSPDGTQIAFTAAIKSQRQEVPSEAAWLESTKEEAEKDAEKGQLEKKPRMRFLTDPKYRFDGRGYIDRRSHLFVVDREGGEPEQLTDGDFDDLEPTWSPDGDAIAFISNRTPDRDYNLASDIWVVDARSRQVRQLNRQTLSGASPAWSPDGRTIAFYARPEWIEHGTHNTHVWAVSVRGGDERDLMSDFDRTHGALLGDHGPVLLAPPVWSPDGRSVYCTMSDRGGEVACRVAVNGGGVEVVSQVAIDVTNVQLAPDGDTLVCCAATPTEPYDVFSGSAAGGDLRPLAHTNRELLDAVRVAPPGRFTYPSVDGWEIEGWLIRPDGAGPFPLVLLVHGGPHAMYGSTFYYHMQVLAGAGIACLYINPRGSGGYGLEFMRAVCADWGGKDFQDLMNGVDQVLAGGDIDRSRLGITGGSYGGFMTNWAIGHTDRFACAVGVNGISNLVSFWGTSDIGALWFQRQMGGPFWERPELYRERSPLSYVTDIDTPLLLIHAENDYRVPIEQSEQMFVALKILRQEVEMVRVPESSHSLANAPAPRHRIERWRLSRAWFDKYLS